LLTNGALVHFVPAPRFAIPMESLTNGAPTSS
jgi:hypothetical protein